ncbi:TetR/AcrR family transcriptional regulator [Actinomycetospora endophytica]|uniref:TetR/AcrR family transcriptional regulator n=1 Tax=Actinomycetospora endophytica TaxID=2291215 RepID=A0ABS8P1P8_9PSEU|nr:TetR family transcriptional regulator [Actinomycetospora endophytica]MCD2192165.1 TetR/AcrR family transcriptional regulator [Actinomycetospora endophytica]
MHETPQRRPYRSDLRARQARETRRAVVDAATRLFVARGYADTTLDAVASAAGVSRRTVVNAVGGKAALLSAAWDVSLVGDDEPVAMADRPAVHAILASTDPAESFRLWAEMTVDVLARAAPIGRALEAAADVDGDAAALLAKADAGRLEGARAFARHLASIGGLGATVDEAGDAFWALGDGRLHRRLVIERGWSTTAFARWLAAQATAAAGLSPDAATARRPGRR